MTKSIADKTWTLAAGTDGFRRSKPPVDTIAPTVPANVLAIPISFSTIRVSFDASTDSQSGVAHYTVERSNNGTSGWTPIGTPAASPYDDVSCTASTTYHYRVTSTDGSPLANTSAASTVVSATTPAGTALSWTTLTPSYLPVIPGLAGFGMDTPGGSGRHLSTPATAVMIVDTLSNVRTTGTKIQSGPDVYRCSLPYALRATFPRVIVFETSGVIDLQRSENVIGPYMTFAGQTAPSPGIFIKNGSLYTKAGDQVFWHYQNYNGDQASGQSSDQRRGLSIGQTGFSKWVVAWSSIFWTSDQALDCSVGGTDFTICHSVFGEALCDSIHPKGVHGYALLFDQSVSRVSCFRNLTAHEMDRSPLSYADDVMFANNIVYNGKGNSSIGYGGYGCNPQNFGHTTNTNVEGNWFIKGPNFSSAFGGTRPIFMQGANSTTAVVAGTKVFFGANHATGWPYTTQLDLVGTGGTIPSGLFASARIASAFPASVVLENPQAAGYLDLCRSSIGARPLDRAAGRDATMWTHVANSLAGMTPVGSCINSPTDVGGYLSVPVNTRSLFDSAAMGGDPMPSGPDRDLPQAGSPRSKHDDWIYRMHRRIA